MISVFSPRADTETLPLMPRGPVAVKASWVDDVETPFTLIELEETAVGALHRTGLPNAFSTRASDSTTRAAEECSASDAAIDAFIWPATARIPLPSRAPSARPARPPPRRLERAPASSTRSSRLSTRVSFFSPTRARPTLATPSPSLRTAVPASAAASRASLPHPGVSFEENTRTRCLLQRARRARGAAARRSARARAAIEERQSPAPPVVADLLLLPKGRLSAWVARLTLTFRKSIRIQAGSWRGRAI